MPVMLNLSYSKNIDMSIPSGYTTVKAVVLSAISDNQESSLHKYPYYLLWAIQGLREYYLDQSPDENVITKKVKVDTRGQAAMPEDLKKILRVGIVSNGRMYEILQDNKISHFREQPFDSKNTGNGNTSYFCNYQYHSYWSNIVCYQSNSIGGGYKPDYGCRKISINGLNINNVYIEYVSTSIVTSPYAAIPEAFEAYIRCYIDYMESRQRDRKRRMALSAMTKDLENKVMQKKMEAYARTVTLSIEQIREAALVVGANVQC